MSEKLKIEKDLIDIIKLEDIEINDSELKLIDNIIQEIAPEIAFIYQIREDESEEQQVKTGRLHENRILGILLKFYFEGTKKVSTGEIEDEYKRYFKEIARSTTSTYLNILKKDSTLATKRDGRIVHYFFKENPPVGITPFWFTRIFCVVPAYFNRAYFFANLYNNVEKNTDKYFCNYENEDKDILVRNFKFITGLIILNIFKNRSSKCAFCQFSKKEIYKMIEERITTAIHDRSDVLPEDLITKVIEKYSEIPIFSGSNIEDDELKKTITSEISRYANVYKKDLDFQIMVSKRRKGIRLKQKTSLKENNEENSKVTPISESFN